MQQTSRDQSAIRLRADGLLDLDSKRDKERTRTTQARDTFNSGAGLTIWVSLCQHTVKQLVDKLSVKPAEVVKRMSLNGVMRTVEQIVDLKFAKAVAADVGPLPPGILSAGKRVSDNSRGAALVKQCFSVVKHTGESRTSNIISPKLWIVNPIVDMLFVCGGMMWLLVTFAIFTPSLFASKSAPIFMLITQIGAVFFLDAHNAATILRICNEKELRAKHKILWLWAPLVLTFLFVLSLLNQTLLFVFLKIFSSLVPQHLTAQSYGICLMYFARAKVLPTRRETMALKLAFALMAITSVVRNFSSKAVSELMGVSIPSLVLVPDSVGWFFAGLAWMSTFAALTMILKRISSEGGYIPTGAIMLAVSTLILLTLGPSLGFAVVFSSAFFHASQYLIVAGLVHLKKAERDSPHLPQMPPTHTVVKSATYWGQTIVLGILLYLALPTALAHFGIPVVKAAVAVLCFASLHHFLADSIIWRMRDPKTKAVLST